jgi:hypothetical protein
MQDKGNPSPSLAEEDAMAEQAVMALLLEDRGHFQIGEVVKAVGGRTLATTDAIARLKPGGLIHDTFDGFIFASRAAVVRANLWTDATP